MKKYLYLIITLFLVSCSLQEKTEIIDNQELKKENKPVILSLWDSLTAGLWVELKFNYPSLLQEKLEKNWYDYEVINAWVSWDTSDNLLSRTDLYLDKKPEIVILVIWWNDWLRWLSTQDMKKNIIDIINKFPDSKIVLGWMDLPANLWEKYRNDFKKVYTEIAEEKNVYFLKYFLENVAGIKSLNNDDMIHPNAKWYEIIVDNLFNFLTSNNLIQK